MKFGAYRAKLDQLYAELEVTPPVQPPAAAKAIAALEKKYGFGLPAELRAAWSSTNGTRAGRAFFARRGYLTGYEFLSTTGAQKAREALAKRARNYAGYVEPEPRDPRIAPGWFQPGWLPFASFGGSTLLLILDLAPARKGRSGQVIAFTHDPDQIEYVASSFERCLAESLAAIKADPEELLGQP